MIVPFISIYTRGIDDISYIVPEFGVILVSAYAAQCLRIPYFRIIKAAGHFKETQNGAYIAALLNVVITVSLVFKYGLIGAALGTLVAMIYHTCYFVWYLRRNILSRSSGYFIKYLISDILVAVLSFMLCRELTYEIGSYFVWIILACKVTLIVAIISLLFSFVFHSRLTILAIRKFILHKKVV